MTQEEKQLLSADLSARLPYGVKYDCMYGSYKGTQELTPIELQDILDNEWLDGVRPYLRPMSSMTEEERICRDNLGVFTDYANTDNVVQYIDWLNAHHFDYRGLIEKGLALEAPEEMYYYMTQEEKQLLLKDLCGRLPYGLIVNVWSGDYKLLGIKENMTLILDSPIYEEEDDLWPLEHLQIKPYLRPMESMTEEEKEEFYMQNDFTTETFCNAHHLDYRSLIEKGLALEAKEGMYRKEAEK